MSQQLPRMLGACSGCWLLHPPALPKASPGTAAAGWLASCSAASEQFAVNCRSLKLFIAASMLPPHVSSMSDRTCSVHVSGEHNEPVA